MGSSRAADMTGTRVVFRLYVWCTVPTIKVSRTRLRQQDCRRVAQANLHRPSDRMLCAVCHGWGHALNKPHHSPKYIAVHIYKHARCPLDAQNKIKVIIINRTHYLCFLFLICSLRFSLLSHSVSAAVAKQYPKPFHYLL